MNNHENQPRYTVTFPQLTAQETDELLSLVFREASVNLRDAMDLKAGNR